MLRKEVHLALNLLAGALPSRGLAFYVRRATTDGTYLRLAGDVRGLTGWTVQDWMGRGGAWRSYVHPEDVANYRSAIFDHLKGVTPLMLCEYRYLANDNTWRWARPIPSRPPIGRLPCRCMTAG